MLKVGESIFADVDIDGTATADKVNAIWTISLEDILDNGPEKGWKFANRTYHGIDRDEITITSLAQASSTTTTVTGTHTLIAGDMVLLDDTNIDDTYDVVSVSTTVSFVVTATFVATDTGTAYWTSEEYAYRFSRPTCIRVTAVKVGGVELTDWVRKGSWILTNEEDDEVDMDYIAAVADLTVTNFPPHFVNAFRMKLASDLAYDLVQNSALGDRLLREYLEVTLPEAIGMDNREIYVQEKSSSWMDAGHSRQTIE
jgi:hypothetical protein